MIEHFNAAWPWLGPLVVGFLLGVLAVLVVRDGRIEWRRWQDGRRFREVDRKLDIMRKIQRDGRKSWQK